MTGTPKTPEPDSDGAPRQAGEQRPAGEQRLARPPSARYGSPSAGEPQAPAGAALSTEASGGRASAVRASAVRGIAFGTIAALLGAALIVLLGGALAISAGLLVAAAALGYAVGIATVAGAGDTLACPARPSVAAVLAAIGALLGQAGLWLFARSEGGVLPLIDYLGQTFGLLVPLEVLLAAAVAAWRAR